MSMKRRIEALEKAAGPTEPDPFEGLSIEELHGMAQFAEEWEKAGLLTRRPLETYIGLSEATRQALALAFPEPFAELTLEWAREAIEFLRQLEELPPEERALAEAEFWEMVAPNTDDPDLHP